MKTLRLFNDIKAAEILGGVKRDSEILKSNSRNYHPYLLFGLLLISWPLLQRMVIGTDETIGFVDPNIWLLILLSLICFLAIAGLSWWLLQRFWVSMELPGLGSMVLRFKELELCYQLGYYFACFALLLLSAVGVLAAVL